MNVVYAFSPSWLEYANIAIFSLLRHNPQEINLYLLTDRLSEADRRSLSGTAKRANVHTQILEVESLYESAMPSGKNVDNRFTRYTLYRLLIPQLLANQEKILYLDTDTLVLQNLDQLYTQQIDNYFAAGVPDLGEDNPKEDLGLAPADPYMNAGVLLLNLAKIRLSGLDAEWIRLCQTRHFKYHDQDIINMTCKGAWLPLDASYNACRTNTGYSGPDGNIKILHYISFKPWREKTIPYAAIWRRYRRAYFVQRFWRNLVGSA